MQDHVDQEHSELRRFMIDTILHSVLLEQLNDELDRSDERIKQSVTLLLQHWGSTRLTEHLAHLYFSHVNVRPSSSASN